jgi:hypothetical protein
MALRFVVTSSDSGPATDLLDALYLEYDARAGRVLIGGPLAEPADFAPPAGPSSSPTSTIGRSRAAA